MKVILIIGSGGFVGSVFRYLLHLSITKIVPLTFPFGTLIVNLVGCFAIGLIYGAFGKVSWLNEDWKLFLAIGICGGFTTFSSFSYDNIKLLQQGLFMQAFMYISASIILGLLLTFWGMMLMQK